MDSYLDEKLSWHKNISLNYEEKQCLPQNYFRLITTKIIVDIRRKNSSS